MHPDQLQFYRIDLIDYLTLFLKSIDKKLKIKDYSFTFLDEKSNEIHQHSYLGSEILTNFIRSGKLESNYSENYYSLIRMCSNYWLIGLSQKKFTIQINKHSGKEGIDLFYEEVISNKILQSLPKDSLVNLMLKEVVNNETLRLSRKKFAGLNRPLKEDSETITLFDCKGRRFTIEKDKNKRYPLVIARIIKVGNFRRVKNIY